LHEGVADALADETRRELNGAIREMIVELRAELRELEQRLAQSDTCAE